MLEKVEGRKLEFVVQAFDDKEKIGEGHHTRFIVNKQRFLSKVGSKM